MNANAYFTSAVARLALACLALLLLHWPEALAQSAPASSPARPEKEPACTHCKERMKTVDALKGQLPAEWSIRMEREAVFGSDMLVVQAGQSNAQTVMLVHGLGQNGFTDWLPALPQLARRYHVIAADLPGFGYSGAPNGKYSPTNYARVLQGLLTRHAKGAAIVIGHSMGAAVSLRLASHQPALVSKLILVDGAGILHRTTFAKHRASLPLSVSNMPELLKDPLARAADLGNRTVEWVFGLPDLTRILRESDLAWDMLLRNRTNVNAALALIEEDFSAAVHTVQQPAQIIWGEADTVAPLRTGQLLARRLPRAELKTMPRVGHSPMLEAPEQFLALLSSALASDPVPPPAAVAALDPTDLRCNALVDQEYSGAYREVVINRCLSVRLVNLSAERIVIRDSIVQMHNVQIRATDVALEVTNSEVVATASEFSGEVAIRADACRIDLAGVDLLSIGNAIEVNRLSRLIASVSRIQSPDYSGYWHDHVELKEGRVVPAPRRD